MSPRTFADPPLREAPLLHVTDTVADAVRALLDADLPAFPVVDERERLYGIFGEREFFGAVFPGYLKELRYAGMIKRELEDALEKRQQCRHDEVRKYVHTEHVDVGSDFSDAQVAEIFMHHRVLIVPVTDYGRVVGVITRADFFRSVAQRFLSA
jgi:CBS domain-containing protein